MPGELELLPRHGGHQPTSPGSGSLINVTGNLAPPSTQIANLNLNGSFGNGYYDLFNYQRTLTGSPSAAFGTGTGAETYVLFGNYRQQQRIDLADLGSRADLDRPDRRHGRGRFRLEPDFYELVEQRWQYGPALR